MCRTRHLGLSESFFFLSSCILILTDVFYRYKFSAGDGESLVTNIDHRHHHWSTPVTTTTTTNMIWIQEGWGSRCVSSPWYFFLLYIYIVLTLNVCLHIASMATITISQHDDGHPLNRGFSKKIANFIDLFSFEKQGRRRITVDHVCETWGELDAF